jgi:hypothetical protein
MANVNFGPCCFCGKAIDKEGVDPCSVTVETREEKSQTWFCHAACFRSRLVPGEWLRPVHF